ncbi:glycosyltransferase family 25 protein [Brevibacterium yomogidense]|uniref:glycosyltransferase family 25 protein n=1 Tax=Brevibacterium yomogidense TaxID=946573 RepID=UPI0018E03A9C|nr:glycosyltransferase family 25 protein [Brevibacterium yomogidense]
MTVLHPRIVESHVVALEDSHRIDGFFAQPGTSCFLRFRAVDGRVGEGLELFDSALFEDRYGRSPLPGEMGCALSHFKIIKRFANSCGRDSDLALVAEDDARFTPGALEVISTVAARVENVGFVVLANDFPTQLSLFSRIVGRTGLRAYRVGHNWGNVWCTGLYLVSRGAARQYMASTPGRVSWVADHYSHFRREMGINVKVLRPSLVSWEGESDIRRGGPTFGAPVGVEQPSVSLGRRLDDGVKKSRDVMAATARDVAWFTGIKDSKRRRKTDRL